MALVPNTAFGFHGHQIFVPHGVYICVSPSPPNHAIALSTILMFSKPESHHPLPNSKSARGPTMYCPLALSCAVELSLYVRTVRKT